MSVLGEWSIWLSAFVSGQVRCFLGLCRGCVVRLDVSENYLLFVRLYVITFFMGMKFSLADIKAKPLIKLMTSAIILLRECQLFAFLHKGECICFLALL